MCVRQFVRQGCNTPHLHHSTRRSFATPRSWFTLLTTFGAPTIIKIIYEASALNEGHGELSRVVEGHSSKIHNPKGSSQDQLRIKIKP